MPEERTFNEGEHQALVQSAVEREVAAAVQDRDARISELEQKVDVLEAEKASAVAAKDEIQAEFDQHKADVEQAKVIEARQTARVEQIKGAGPHLPDSYFTPERASRWAAMDDADFDALVDDFQGAALAGLTAEEAKEAEGLQGEALTAKLSEIRAKRQERTDPARETAAFSGGRSPTSVEGQTVVGKFFAARRGDPVNQ